MDSVMGVRALALVTSFAIGGVSGYAVRAGMEGDLQRNAESPSIDEAVAELRDLAVELRSTVDRLSQRPDSGLTAPAPAREPVQAEGSATDLEAVRQLLERLERSMALSAPLRSPIALVIPDRRSQPIPPEPEDDAAQKALEHRFLFWTYQQVLDAFGMPDSISIDNGGAEWVYERGERRDRFVLQFHDGLVMEVP